MQFIKKSFTLPVFIIFLSLIVSSALMFGMDGGLFSDNRSLFFILSALFLLIVLSLYKLINLSNWGKGKMWKKVVIVIAVCIISLFLVVAPLLFLVSVNSITGCDLGCNGWQCSWNCPEYDELFIRLPESYDYQS